MSETVKRYQAGYRDPVAEDWVFGVIETDPAEAGQPAVEVGYFDMETEVWLVGVPDIEGGQWLPLDAVLTTGEPECPSEFIVKGNLPSRVYHVPGQSSYRRTTPEICFASEEAAVAAGFRAAHPGRHVS